MQHSVDIRESKVKEKRKQGIMLISEVLNEQREQGSYRLTKLLQQYPQMMSTDLQGCARDRGQCAVCDDVQRTLEIDCGKTNKVGFRTS